MSDHDYSAVIDAEDYTEGLAEHPDVPQADAGILRIIKEAAHSSHNHFRVLDLGCGPGRLTQLIGKELQNNCEVIGLDISEGFISYAEAHKKSPNVSYIKADFLNYEFDESFDVILMQGLFHHVSLNTRKEWMEKCRRHLKDDGIIIIGDEFVPSYSSNEDRVIKVAGLYAYVVAYALQNGHASLATIESMNLVDDVCSGLPGAGHSNPELIHFIQQSSQKIYQHVYEQGTDSKIFSNLLTELVAHVQNEAAKIAGEDAENHDRGDYKVSIQEQEESFQVLGLSLEKKQVYGPVAWLGGMAVLVFRRS